MRLITKFDVLSPFKFNSSISMYKIVVILKKQYIIFVNIKNIMKGTKSHFEHGFQHLWTNLEQAYDGSKVANGQG